MFVFAGPLLFIPEVTDGNIGEVEVFAPCNGHHVGAVFVPGVIFTDAELDDPKGKRWPEPESFSLLDPHRYAVEPDADCLNGLPQVPFPATASISRLPITRSSRGAKIEAATGICRSWCEGTTLRLVYFIDFRSIQRRLFPRRRCPHRQNDSIIAAAHVFRGNRGRFAGRSQRTEGVSARQCGEGRNAEL